MDAARPSSRRCVSGRCHDRHPAQKTHRSLAELTSTWRERAAGHVPEDEQLAWVSSLAGRNDLPLLHT